MTIFYLFFVTFGAAEVEENIQKTVYKVTNEWEGKI